MIECGCPFGGPNQPAPSPGKPVADWPDEPHENEGKTPVLRYNALYHCLNNVSSELVAAFFVCVVHSHIDHLVYQCALAAKHGIQSS